MDGYNSYYTEAETSYRRDLAHQLLTPARRNRRDRAWLRKQERAEFARRTMGDDLAS